MNNYAHIIAPLFLCVLPYFNPRSPMVLASMGAIFIPISKFYNRPAFIVYLDTTNLISLLAQKSTATLISKDL